MYLSVISILPMKETHDDFISEAVDILVELLKGKEKKLSINNNSLYEEVRRINYLVNTAKLEDLKKSLNKLKSMSIEELSDFADMITRVFKEDKEFLENEMTRLEEIFITKRINDKHGKMERFISICNCAYIALNTSIKEYKELYNQLYHNCRNRY